MMENYKLEKITIEHLVEYGCIYAGAFSGEPWNDPWKEEDAIIHIRELMESKQVYGLECVDDDKVVGFILGTSMLFHSGRTFEIHDLVVDPNYQKFGTGSRLLQQCLTDIQDMGMVGVYLVTAAEGALPRFYEKYGFSKEQSVILMGKEIEN